MRLAHNDYVWKPMGYSAVVATVSDEIVLTANEQRVPLGHYWCVEIDENESFVISGYAPTVEDAKQAAVDAWKSWAKKQAEDAGFIVT